MTIPFLLMCFWWLTIVSGLDDDDLLLDCSCTANYISSVKSMEMTSPYYRHNLFCSNIDCTYTIEPSSTEAVVLSFLDVKTNDDDSLEVYQLLDINGTTVRMFQGRPFNDGSGMSVYDSLHSAIGVGFLIRFTGGIHGEYLMSFNRTAKSLCQHPLLVGSTEPSKIPVLSTWPHSGCLFRIEAPPSRVLFLSTTGATIYRGVEARKGNSTLLWSSKMSTKYETMGYVDIWVLTYTLETFYHRSQWPTVEYYIEPCDCNSTSHYLRSIESVTLYSPGYPNTYCSQLRCAHNFTLQPAVSADKHTVFLITLDYKGRHENDDMKLIIDGNIDALSSTGPHIRANEQWVFAGSELSFTFNTETEMENHGYQMSVQRFEVGNDCICSSVGTKPLKFDGSLALTIPAHCHLMTCRYEIPLEEKANIRAKTEYLFSSENEHITIISTTDNIRNRYSKESDEAMTKLWMSSTSGVHIQYTRLEDESVNNTRDSYFNVTWQIGGPCQCDSSEMVATPEWNHFVSPDFPGNYCNNMSCNYTVTAPPNSHIVVNVSNFYTEPHNDVFTISEEIGGKRVVLKRLHGKIGPGQVAVSTGKKIDIQFESDHAVSGKGFVLYYKSVTNDPTESTTVIGTVSSPTSFRSSEHHSFVVGWIATAVLISIIVFFLYKRGNLRIQSSKIYQPVVSFHNQTDESTVTSLHSTEATSQI